MKDHSKRQPVRQPPPEPAKKISYRFSLAATGASILIIGSIILITVACIHIPDYFAKPVNRDRIVVTGNTVLSPEAIIDYLKLVAPATWSDLDPFRLSLHLRTHLWIEQALVHRTPDLGLAIQIVERVPIAYLKTKDELFLLGSDGLVLNPIRTPAQWNLVVIVDENLQGIQAGDRLSSTALRPPFSLIELLKESKTLPLSAVSEIIVTDPLNIQLITIPDGLRIKLGFSGFSQKLTNLHHAMPRLHRERNRVDYLDLRHERGVVIRRKTS